MPKNNKNKFYVYAYLDTRKPGKYEYNGTSYCFLYEPFYIGKGRNKRYKEHLAEAKKVISGKLNRGNRNKQGTNWHKVNKILSIYKTTQEWPQIVFLNDGLSEKEAFDIEAKHIVSIGRYDLKTGQLTNMSDGGGGVSNPSEERRKQMSINSSGKNNNNYGKKLPEETKEKLRLANSGKNSANYGKKLSEEAKSNLSIQKTGKKASKKHKLALKKGWEKRKQKYKNGYSEKQRHQLQSNKGKINIKKFKIIDPNNKVYYTENGLTLFCEEYGLSQGCMSSVATGRSKQHRGWKCELVKNEQPKLGLKKYKAINPKGEIFYIDNGLKSFGKIHNLNPSNMSSVLTGSRKQYKGWTFKYA